MAGYYGQSMSNNAVASYNAGNMPESKWTREAFVGYYNNDDSELRDEITERAQNDNKYWYNEKRKTNPNYSMDNAVDDYKSALGRSSASWLRDQALIPQGWHHTSKFYNQTNFYSPSATAITAYSPDDLTKQRKIKSAQQIVRENDEKSREEKSISRLARDNGFFDKKNNPTQKLVNAYHMMSVPYINYANNKYDAVRRVNGINNPYASNSNNNVPQIVSNTQKAIKLGQPMSPKDMKFLNDNKNYVENELENKRDKYLKANDYIEPWKKVYFTDEENKTYNRYYKLKNKQQTNRGLTPQKALGALDELNAHSISHRGSTLTDMKKIYHLKSNI